MPPKRKRTDTTSLKGKQACLATILQELLRLSKDPKRCSDALQAFVDDKYGSDEDVKNVDCYWILLATHVMHRMTVELQSHKKQPEEVCVVLALFCHALSTILLSDRTKLEKCANAATASARASKVARSAVCRAICVVSIGSTVALQHVVNVSSSKLTRHALWACLFSLEAVIHLSNASPPKPHTGDESWGTAQQRIAQDEPEEQDTMAACEVVSPIVCQEAEEACVAAMMPSSSPKKTTTKRSSRKQDASSGVSQRFQELMDEHQANSIVMDGRVSIRRWASMAFVWLCRGQESVLNVVMNLLTRAEQWTDVLDCPALAAAPASPKKASPRGKKQAPPVSPQKTVRVPGNVALVALACRLVDVVSESGNACGARAPTGGMDAYAATLVSPQTSTSKRKSPKKQGNAWTRPDVRNAATVVSYWLIQAHSSSLETNCTENLVGDPDSRSVVTVAEEERVARFYPFVHKSLDALCRAAASSVVSSASVDASDYVRRLLGIASAWCLGTVRVVDVKLCGFGLSNLSECLRNAVSDDESSVGSSTQRDEQEARQERYRRLVEEYQLDTPLPTPTMPSKPAARSGSLKKKSSSSDSEACTFGGIFRATTDADHISNDEPLSLYLRALHSSDGTPAAALFSKLLTLARCCYDTPQEEEAAPQEVSKKRGARKKAPTSKSKRRKVGKDKEDASAQPVGEVEETAVANRKRMNSIRSGLATDVMNVLKTCLVRSKTGMTSTRSPLRYSLRESFGTKHITDFVQLGVLLDEVLILSHVLAENQKGGTNKRASSFFSSGDFTHSEKCLWTAHTNVCLVLGREQTAYNPQRFSVGEPILGDAATRLVVFRAIAAVGNGVLEGKGEIQWPLFLPAVHHALIASNLTSEPLQDGVSVDPERFIVKSFISSIETALQDLSIIANWSFPYGNGSAVPKDVVPLTLQDARLFVLSVCRLPGEEQRSCLSNLVDIFYRSLSSIKSRKSDLALVASGNRVSGFLARLATVCATLVHTVSVAPSLREALFLQVGPTQYQLPTLATQTTVDEDSDTDWYTREQCFQGMFSYWESPTIPEVRLPDSPKPLDKVVAERLNSIFCQCLHLGFLSAKNDKCHLLSSAWNASGKASAWDLTNRNVQLGAAGPNIHDQAPQLLMELREDVCRAHREIHGNACAFSDSLLSSALQRRDKGRKATNSKVKQTLKSMLEKAESLVNSLVDDIEQSSIPLATYTLFEMLAVYIAFIVAEHTKAGTDVFLHGMRKPKSPKRKSGRDRSSYDDPDLLAARTSIIHFDDSGESDNDFSGFDDDISEDARMATLTRLHKACVSFGAAPTHPDWLDGNCRLREGITAAEVVAVAEKALRCLNKLTTCAYTRYVQSRFDGINMYAESGPDQDRRAALALELCNMLRKGGNEDADISIPNHVDVISQLCQVDKRGLEKLFGVPSCRNIEYVIGAWGPNSAQRIQGRFPDRSITIDAWERTQCELRAGGEWELLLSNALLGACFEMENSEVSASKRSRSPKKSASKNVWKETHHFVDAEHWRRVYETSVSNLMPAAALLSFGLGRATGRATHPLNSLCAEIKSREGKYPTPFLFTENLPVKLSTAEGTKEEVCNILSLLSRISTTSDRGSDSRTVCYAVSANLNTDADFMVDLESMQLLRTFFSSLFALRDIFADAKLRPKVRAAVTTLKEAFVQAIETYGAKPTRQSATSTASRDYTALVQFLGSSSLLTWQSIAGSVEPTNLLSPPDARLPSQLVLHEWKLGSTQQEAITEMVSLLGSVELDLDEAARACLSRTLAGVAEFEYERVQNSTVKTPVLIQAIAFAFDCLGNDHLTTVVSRDMCMLLNDGLSSSPNVIETSKMICKMIAFMLAVPCDQNNVTKSVLSTLFETMNRWCDGVQSVSRDHVLDLLFLLGTRFDSLSGIGSRLVSNSSVDSKSPANGTDPDLVSLERFFRFVREASDALTGGGAESTTKLLPHSGLPAAETLEENPVGQRLSFSNETGQQDKIKTVLCSYARDKNFHDQHWYNCYTCGLVSDRGCCSTCANVCHLGHDIGYSRNSSFFCDCGAENASALEENRVSCKCLTAVSTGKLLSVAAIENTNDYYVLHKSSPGVVETCQAPKRTDFPQNNSIEQRWIRLACHSFGKEAKSSIANLIQLANNSSWIRTLYGLIRHQFNLWNENNAPVPYVESSQFVSAGPPKDTVPKNFGDILESLRISLFNRKGQILDLQPSSGEGMVPVRAAKANSFKMNMSADSTTDRLKRAMLKKNEIRRVAIAADSRGRLIIAEPSSLLFCTALPAVNVRYVEKPSETPLERRANMCILGSSSLKFNIVGMRLCRENERHLVVWGAAEACVVVLSSLCDRVEKTVDLVFDLEPQECESDYLLKCEWLPGSQTLVAVACGPFIKIFSVERMENEGRLVPVICYSLAFEAMLRDIALVPMNNKKACETPKDNHLRKDTFVKVFLLLDSGRIHVVDVKADSHGDLEEQGERYLDPDEGISLPIAGVRLYQGASPSQPESFSRSIGEGSTCGLSYLSQSGLLLYSCVSSCVMALILDAEGKVSSSFEFLPHVVSSDIIGNGSDGYDITGPYAHWTELGVVKKQGSLFFRVGCVGKSSKTGQPKIICVDYNENAVKVKELSWVDGYSMGLGLSLSLSFDGFAAFSAPMISSDDYDGTRIIDNVSWQERTFLVGVTSNGAMLIFGEETNSLKHTSVRRETLEAHQRRRAVGDSDDSSGVGQARDPHASLTKTLKPSFPNLVFEKLTNASEWEELTYSTDGVGSDAKSIKTKLSGKNSNVFYMTPSREGCTLAISIRSRGGGRRIASGGETRSSRDTSAPDADRTNFAIVALRVQVGSTTTDFIPRRFLIEGRPVELQPDVKRWYDLPLTHEEVALSIRNGFVSLGIGPSFDRGNNPLVDAVEVFVTERENINPWLPRTILTKEQEVPLPAKESEGEGGFKVLDRQRSLVLSIVSATHACKLFCKNDEDVSTCKQTLRGLIHATAVSCKKNKEIWDCMIALLETVEEEADDRQVFLNENILFGLARSLNTARSLLDAALRSEGLVIAEGISTGGDHESSGPAQFRSSFLSMWSHVKEVLKDCSTIGAGIAKLCSETYVRSNLKMISDGLSSASLSVELWNIFEKGIKCSMDCTTLVPSLVELTLTELSVAFTAEDVARQEFAKFDVISNLLRHPDVRIVECACSSILSYVSETSKTKQLLQPNVAPESAERTDSYAPIAYKCDSCSLFPITDKRFTLLEGDHDIDLCTQCFRIGNEFSANQAYDSGVDVVIQGKSLSLGDGSRLTCAQVKQMQSLPIARNIEEQVEQARRAINPSGVVEGEAAIRNVISAGDITGSETVFPPVGAQQQSTIQHKQQDVFTTRLFTDILNIVFGGEKDMSVCHPVSLFQMVLGMIFSGEREEVKLDRGKQFAKRLATKLSELLQLGGKDQEAMRQKKVSIVIYLRCLVCLVLQKQGALTSSAKNKGEYAVSEPEGLLGGKSKEKTDPRFVCDVHDVPAVRRRCSNGVNKNRRFYVCGMERKSRCDYFKWADTEEMGCDDTFDPNVSYQNEMQRFMWALFRTPLSVDSLPLHVQVCDMLSRDFFSYEQSCEVTVCRPSEVKSIEGGEGHDAPRRLDSMYDRQAAYQDVNDGVFCSKQKLSMCSGSLLPGEEISGINGDGGAETREPLDALKREESSIEAALELLALIAEDSTQTGTSNESVLNWFSVLCEIMSSSSSNPFRSLAKNSLKRLCGMRRAVYHSVRDHYVFGFQYEKLVMSSFGCLEEAIVRKEQARQCGANWKKGEPIDWTTLRAGGMIGTQDLLSESCLSIECSKKISIVLEELMDVTRNRSDNWKQFLSVIPRSQRRKRTGTTALEVEAEDFLVTSGCPPVISLFWVACSLSGSSQIKAFTLIETALNPSGAKSVAGDRASPEGEVLKGGDVLSSDGGLDSEVAYVGAAQTNPFFNGDRDVTPEDALLGGKRGLSVDEIHAFTVQYVFKGRTAELRKIASQVAQRLCRKLSHQDLNVLLLRMLGAPFSEISGYGSDCIEFLEFLQDLVRHCKSSESLQCAGNTVIRCFTTQMQSLKQDANGSGDDSVILETNDGGNQLTRARFDLSCCCHCHRKIPARPAASVSEDRGSQETRESSRTRGYLASDDPGGPEPSRNQTLESTWLPEQVKPFVRRSLESSTDASVSTEFANFVKLKYRLALSNIHVAVNDPRGRFVKKIAVYFTPRPVGDVGILKSEDYCSSWQRCATLSLTRGASRSSCSLPDPVVAANLKFEYLEFYDKPASSSRSSDGSLVLHCPRCTRIVNNAHGVCGNCGEVAFQCRKCRHINYDRLDAFLCVECGYCSCGGFSFELTAGISSNAVAVVDEDSYVRASKILRVATKLHDDLRSRLRDKATSAVGRKRRRWAGFDEINVLGASGPSLKRAFLGQLPLAAGGKGDSHRSARRGSGGLRDSAVASIASSRRADSNNHGPSSNKARSLIRLARQLRGSGSERRSGDFFVRQTVLNSSDRGLLVEDIEDNGDMLGIINSSSDAVDVFPTDSSDSLSRLVASIQSRSRETSGRNREEDADVPPEGDGGGGGGNSGGDGEKEEDSSPVALFQELDRLHQLMREAERECFEVQRRIDSWKRLQYDALADFGSVPCSTPFTPTRCGVCAEPVAMHLLVLVMELFQVGMDDLEESITKDFVRTLFDEPPTGIGKDLFDLKRLAIHTLAVKSKRGARLVLNELQGRLRATRDVASAEILGKLLQSEFSLVDEYVSLALETAAVST